MKILNWASFKKFFSKKIAFKDLEDKNEICLYAGDIPKNCLYSKFIGLSLSQADFQHIKFDITERLPLRDSCVDIYQSEDVFKHINLDEILFIVNDIYRVLKPGGVFRLSLPDYQFDVFYNRTLKSDKGELLFDPGGGGYFADGKVGGGGHVWFPTYRIVKDLLEKILFKNISFYHYYDDSGIGVTKPQV